MSLSHHGEYVEPAADRVVMERLLAQIERTARREYPAGRMGADDDGALSFAIATDHANGCVVIRFGKPVEWIGLGPADLAGLIQRLIAGYRAIAAEPLSIAL